MYKTVIKCIKVVYYLLALSCHCLFSIKSCGFESSNDFDPSRQSLRICLEASHLARCFESHLYDEITFIILLMPKFQHHYLGTLTNLPVWMMNSRQRSGRQELGTISRRPTASVIFKPFNTSVFKNSLSIFVREYLNFSIFKTRFVFP